MRLHSRIFMPEFKNNHTGKFLQLSVTKEAFRTFIIFPAGWNEQGWIKIFQSIEEIMGQAPLEPALQQKGSILHSEPKSYGVGPPPPSQRPGCCPKCGFVGEPTNSFRCYAELVSPPPSTESQQEATTKLPRRKGKQLGPVHKPKSIQVYVRKSSLGLNSHATNKGLTTNGEVTAAKGVPDASLALLYPTPRSPLC